MKIDELLHQIEPGAQITVVNEPFTFAGRVTLTLDGGDVRYWLYSKESSVLAIAPDDDEIISFKPVDEDLEPQAGMILYQGREYESNYDDAGSISELIGEVESMEEDRYAFSDYESDDGNKVRLITNENTGERQAFRGEVVVDEEILSVD